jgi:hypothetical protein
MSLNRLPLNTSPLNAGAGVGGAVLTSRAGAKSSLFGQLGATLSNKAGAKSTLTAQLGAVLLNQAGARSTIDQSTVHALLPAIGNKAGATSSLSAQFTATLANKAGAKSSLSGVIGQYATLSNQAGARSQLSGLVHAILPVLSNKAGAKSTASPMGWLVLSNKAGAKSSLTATSQALLSLSNKAGAKSGLTGVIGQYALLSNKAGAKSSLTGVAHLLATLSNKAGAASYLAPGSQTELWVFNTTTGGVSRYEGLGDATFAWLNGKLLIASSAGLFELAGSDDNGTPILSAITTGRIDFGSHLLKRVDSLNIGFESSGTLEATTIISQGGMPSSATNQWATVPAVLPRDGVLKLGKGLKSRYWKFQIGNRDGSSFVIDKIDYHPLILSRRR